MRLVIHPPRKVPVALKDRVKTELERMQKIGVVEKQESPTPWVNSMVTVIKPNKSVRICIDPRDLNKAIMREHYPMKTIEDVIVNIPEAKVFSKLDATSGFWQVELDEESQKLCTFNTPFGRYSFKRLPFGIKSAPEVYQKIISEMVQDIDGCEAIVDDILIWGKDMTEHDERLKRVLSRAREYNLKLNKSKCEFRKDQVTYVGHTLSSEGVKPDVEKVRAVKEMSAPQNKKELMTFMGFIQYLGKFLPNLSEIGAPLRVLLEKETEWHWETPQEKSFQMLKSLISKTPVLCYYDHKKPLVLSVDASSKGLGAVLIQEEKPVAYASRALTKCQQNYAQIEKEALAIAYGCQKFHEYVFGRQVQVESDHKPLQSIFKKPLYKAPPRLQRLLLNLQKYDLEVTYKPGKEMFLADTLSRAYLEETKEDLLPDFEVNTLMYLPVTPEKHKELQEETARDEELQQLQDVVLDGWPIVKSELSHSIRQYWNFRDEIACVDGLMFKNHKIIVPRTMRRKMLNLIHKSHLGVVKCKSRARDVLYWPGMSSEIEDIVSKCSVCALHLSSNNKEPMMPSVISDRPWSTISADIFEIKGQHYLVSVDHYSKWPEVAKLDDLSSKNTIQYMKSQCSRYGLPDKVITDNGPQFACAEFENFAKSYNFVHVTSSPHYPQSNGQAERAVQTVKKLLKKADDPYKAVLDYRNTNIEEIGLSPAQMFLGRRLKTDLPTTSPLLETNPQHEIKMRMTVRQAKQKYYFDQHSGKELKSLHSGDNVVMRQGGDASKWVPATVINPHESPRSYIVETANRKYRRNRRHLRKTNADVESPNHHNDDHIHLDTNFNSNMDGKADRKTDNRLEQQPVVIKPPLDSPISKTRSGRIVKTPTRFEDFVK